MARPDRRRPAPSGANAPKQGGRPMGPSGPIDDIRAINSSVLLLTQKMKYIIRNEKILGRNLIVLNKKLKSLEEKTVSPKEVSGGASSDELKSLKKKVDLLEAQVSDLQSRLVTKEEFLELKYIIDSINPLEFVTLSQVKEMIEKNKK